MPVVVAAHETNISERQRAYEYVAAGVLEYWLLDPDRAAAEFYHLDEHGRYQTIAPAADGFYTSRALPGFRLRVAWLWQEPLPDPVDALLNIDRDAYTAYLREKMGL